MFAIVRTSLGASLRERAEASGGRLNEDLLAVIQANSRNPVEARGDILSLVSSVAGSYINLRSLDRQLEIARSTANTRRESYDIFVLRFEGGVISLLELSQNKSQYEEALATIPGIEKAIAQQENGLSVLLGRNPGPIVRGKDIDHLILPAIPAGLPSELIERRPDLRRAEQNLIAANALILSLIHISEPTRPY